MKFKEGDRVKIKDKVMCSWKNGCRCFINKIGTIKSINMRHFHIIFEEKDCFNSSTSCSGFIEEDLINIMTQHQRLLTK